MKKHTFFTQLIQALQQSLSGEGEGDDVVPPFLSCVLSQSSTPSFPGSSTVSITSSSSSSSSPSFSSLSAASSFQGLCCLPPPPFSSPSVYSSINRRIDIKVYPYSQYPFALLFFTGSALFNRSMRHRARDLHLTLTDHSLSPAHRVEGRRERVWIGKSIHCESEEEIFYQLGLRYIPPSQRNGYKIFQDTDFIDKKKETTTERKESESVKEEMQCCGIE